VLAIVSDWLYVSGHLRAVLVCGVKTDHSSSGPASDTDAVESRHDLPSQGDRGVHPRSRGLVSRDSDVVGRRPVLTLHQRECCYSYTTQVSCRPQRCL
jgi:hypothetical protein